MPEYVPLLRNLVLLAFALIAFRAVYGKSPLRALFGGPPRHRTSSQDLAQGTNIALLDPFAIMIPLAVFTMLRQAAGGGGGRTGGLQVYVCAVS